MKLRPMVAVLLPLLLSSLTLADAASAASPSDSTPEKLRTPGWWFEQSRLEAAKIADPLTRANALLHTGHLCADSHDLAQVALIARDIESLLLQKPSLALPNEPQWLLARVRIGDLAVRGRYADAVAFLDEPANKARRSGLRTELIAGLALHRQTDALRAAIADKASTSEEIVRCVIGLLTDARIRLDGSVARSALALLPASADAPDCLRKCIFACLPPDAPPDSPGARFLIALMPESPARADIASQIAPVLANHGFHDDALAIAQLVPITGRRAEVLRDLAKALTLDGRAAAGRKLIAAETDARCIEQATFGLAMGLARRGQAADLQKLPKIQQSGDAADLEAEILAGAIVHGKFGAGLAQLQNSSSARLRSRCITAAVPELIQQSRLEEAAQLAALYQAATYYTVMEKGRLCQLLGKASCAAGTRPALTPLIQSLHDVLPRVPKSSTREAARVLAAAHAALNDPDGALAIAASLPDPADRDLARSAAARGAADTGDLANIPRILAACEVKSPGTSYMHSYAQIAIAAARSGCLQDLPDWVNSFPDPEARAWTYALLAEPVAELQRNAAPLRPTTRPALTRPR